MHVPKSNYFCALKSNIPNKSKKNLDKRQNFTLMQSKKLLLVALCFFLFASSVHTYAQDDAAKDEQKAEDSDESSEGEEVKGAYPYPAYNDEEYKNFVPKGRQDQQDKFMDRKYNFPARPRDRWEIGIDVGSLLVSGDIKTGFGGKATNGHVNLGYGAHIRKSFGYIFSMRANFMMGTAYGQNWQGTQGWNRSSIDPNHTPNIALGGGDANYDAVRALDGNAAFNRQPDYRGVNNDLLFYNYKTNIREGAISGILSLHNIRFHKQQTKISLYGLAGIGGLWYRTMMNQLDEDGAEYDYGTISRNYGLAANRGGMLTELNDLRDDTYESQAERHFDDYYFFGKDSINLYSFRPTAHVGVGVDFKLSRRLNLGLETKVTYTNDDLLDGQRWQESGVLTRDYDTYVFTGAHLNYSLGGKNSVEPLWWMNPLDYAYKELNEAPCCDDLPEMPDLADNDKDGVPNAWDQEPESREGCPVDTHGRMLDSDRDGVLDCDDKEPHTRYDAIKLVDKYGVAPKMTCKDLDLNGICDCVKGCIPPPQPIITRVDPCDNVGPFPTILFDLNKFSIKPEFESQLAEVARILNMCPNLKLCVTGYTDVRATNPYNDVLSYKRAQEVVKALTSKYGINPSQLVLQYRGESENVVSGLADTGGRKGFDADHALNRRVEFRVCPSEMNMSKPKGPNAGKRQP